jgi:hypothetical protein
LRNNDGVRRERERNIQKEEGKETRERIERGTNEQQKK